MPDPMQTYSELHPAPVCSTISVLARRIHERFPGSGLSQVAAELVTVAAQNQSVIENLRRPLWWLRGLATLTIVALVAVVVWAAIDSGIWSKADSPYPSASKHRCRDQ